MNEPENQVATFFTPEQHNQLRAAAAHINVTVIDALLSAQVVAEVDEVAVIEQLRDDSNAVLEAAVSFQNVLHRIGLAAVEEAQDEIINKAIAEIDQDDLLEDPPVAPA